MNSWAKSVFIGAAASMLGAWLFVGAFVAWTIHKMEPMTGLDGNTAISWDLRSMADSHFVGALLVTVVAFFGIGVWVDCRFLRTTSAHR